MVDTNAHVCFIGGGTMGCYNSLLAALAGHRVVLYDVSEETLLRVLPTMNDMAGHMIAAGLQDADGVATALERVGTETDLAKALDGAWLVSESVFEDITLKRDLFARLDKMCPPNVLLTTNSSALLVSDMEDALAHGERFAALHSHLGAMLFDIVGGPRTTQKTKDKLQDYVKQLGGVALILEKENKGYVFNAMIGPVLTAAMLLVIDGVATVPEVDRAWMKRTKSPMGPFGMIDLFGTSLIYDSWNNRPDEPGFAEMKFKILSLLAPIVGAGRLGMKTGWGFYSYPEPAYAAPDFLDGQPDTSSADYALTAAWTQNAVLLAANEIVSPQVVDRAWMVATRQPKGPFAILDDIGLERALILFGISGPLAGLENVEKLQAFLMSQMTQGKAGRDSGEGFYTYPEPAYLQAEFISGEAI